MQKVYQIILIILFPLVIVAFFMVKKVIDKNGTMVPKESLRIIEKKQVVYHYKLDELTKEFKNVHEVTEACLSCHTERGEEIMKSSHWLWQREEEIAGKGKVPLGKRNILNNFCIGTRSNEGTCTRCHIGYGFDSQDFDFTNPLNIDCLVCHDNTGTYVKEKGEAGYPAKSVDLNYVARNVGTPTKENCGVCHFWGGGGNNVKHGDLEKALLNCSREVDVHMGQDGHDMECIDCHVTENHEMSGKLYALSSENKSRATCEQCHSKEPHTNKLLNEHNLRVACQTCHIPEYAKVNATKMIWDWSNAGMLDEEGNEMHWNDQDGNHKYLSIKGTFVYDDHVIPEYYWFNGIASHQLIEDKIESVPVQMNTLYGSYCDKGKNRQSKECSKIWPVKVHRGKQYYDPVYNNLIQVKTWDKEKGKGAFWKDFDLLKACEAGMAYVGQEFSGKVDMVETEMYWPLSHMVSPKEKSLDCKACHIREKGRLDNLREFYMPGRDRIAGLDMLGKILILMSVIGVCIHAFCRVTFKQKCIMEKIVEHNMDKGKKD